MKSMKIYEIYLSWKKRLGYILYSTEKRKILMGQNTGLVIVRLVRITTAPAQFAKKLIGPEACGAKILMRPRRDR